MVVVVGAALRARTQQNCWCSSRSDGDDDDGGWRRPAGCGRLCCLNPNDVFLRAFLFFLLARSLSLSHSTYVCLSIHPNSISLNLHERWGGSLYTTSTGTSTFIGYIETSTNITTTKNTKNTNTNINNKNQ